MDFKWIWLDDFSDTKNVSQSDEIQVLTATVAPCASKSLKILAGQSKLTSPKFLGKRTMHSMNFLNITSVRQPTSLNWELQEMLFCILWVCCDLTQKLQIKKTQVGKHPSFSKNLVSFKLAILSSCMASSLSWTVPASTWVKVYRTSRFGGEMWTRSLEHTVLMDSVLASYMVYMFCFF